MKQSFLLICLSFLFIPLYAEVRVNNASGEMPGDTLKSYMLGEILVVSSNKETNNLRFLPSSYSVVSPKAISNNQIYALKDLSSYVPNLFIPDYGSRMTSAVYIRGIGARSAGQSIGLYVDNVPYMDKSTFDFDLMDIQRIDVLRGPQGTLYGRNAMGGIVNIYTKSPFDYQGTKVSVGGGNHGLMRGSISHFNKVNDRLAFSLSGYYNQDNGYFTNSFTGKKVDDQTNAGGRAKLEWLISDTWKGTYSASFDHTNQGAYPYKRVDSLGLHDVNYNDKGSYERNTFTNSVALTYENDDLLFASTTGYQYNDDNMWMDQDYTSDSIFTLNQRQKQHSINEELSLKSNNKNNYQWTVGAFGFYNDNTTDAPVTFREGGINSILKPVFDNIKQMNPKAPAMTITDKNIEIPGLFETPTYGFALFHQSTYNNLLIDGLSATLGLRLDYEKAKLDYDTRIQMNMMIKPAGMPFSMPFAAKDTLLGNTSKEFLQLTPKFSLKYECSPSSFFYGSVTKGYKTGGYNIQMFSDLIQQEMMKSYSPAPGAAPTSVNETVSYDPEYSWNYEFGTRGELIPGKLNLEACVYYIDVKDIQLTKFVPSGQGRMIVNAAKATSKGVEVSVDGELFDGLTYFANYGFNDATFDEYKTNVKVNGKVMDVDYKGNHIPFAPGNTVKAGLSYLWNLNKSYVDQILFSAQYQGAGKIYWSEANDIVQDYYSTVNGKISFTKGDVELGVWGKNLTNTNYNTFYFESLGNSFLQAAKPITFGADLILRF
ncbi:MAG: TonB-dependent receptor [Bacteroidales bacterium]|nr:TonB-dependent receptor [Bacteroidales bacterium]